MTYAANSTLDFVAIAREIGAGPALSTGSEFGKEGELVPAEVNSRRQREGANFLRRPALNGATVDQEGLINNYAVEPDMYYAAFPSPEQIRQYARQGGLAAILVLGLVFMSVVAS